METSDAGIITESGHFHRTLWKGNCLDGVLTLVLCMDARQVDSISKGNNKYNGPAMVHFSLENNDGIYAGQLQLESPADNVDKMIEVITDGYMAVVMDARAKEIADGRASSYSH
jgi:hypothetical protein